MHKRQHRDRLNRRGLSSFAPASEVNQTNDAKHHDSCGQRIQRSSFGCGRLTGCVWNQNNRSRILSRRRLNGFFPPRLARVSDEPVPAARDSLNKLHASGTLAQRFAQQRDVLGQISFLDKGVGPHTFHQIVFRDDLPAMLYEGDKDVENLWSEWNQLTFPQQDALRRFKAKTTKFIAVTLLLTH